MLQLKNITVIYNKGTLIEKIVLNQANLEIQKGELVALIGNNGAGKSTIAKVIAGEISVSSGKIYIDKQDCTNFSVVQRSALISRVFQDPMKGTVPGLSVLENLVFARNRKKSRRLKIAIRTTDRKFFADKLAILNMGLENKLDHLVALLSGGQRQALSLLMATFDPGKILILDEHTAALDPEAAKLVLSITNQIIQTNHLTALMVTHQMEELTYCTKLYSVNNYGLHLVNKEEYLSATQMARCGNFKL